MHCRLFEINRISTKLNRSLHVYQKKSTDEELAAATDQKDADKFITELKRRFKSLVLRYLFILFFLNIFYFMHL